MTTTKLTLTPELKARFQAYHDLNPVWGSLHIVLEDGNVKDHFVQFCIDYAVHHGDEEGVDLGVILLCLSKTQRLKLREG